VSHGDRTLFDGSSELIDAQVEALRRHLSPQQRDLLIFLIKIQRVGRYKRDRKPVSVRKIILNIISIWNAIIRLTLKTRRSGGNCISGAAGRPADFAAPFKAITGIGN
jgi:hypothetical protein